MIVLKFLTAGDKKKDEAIQNIIDRRVNCLTELTNDEPIVAILNAFDIALEVLKNNNFLNEQKRIADQERWLKKYSIINKRNNNK